MNSVLQFLPLLLLAPATLVRIGNLPKTLTNEVVITLREGGITKPVLNQMLRSATEQKQSGASFGVLTGRFPVKDAAGKTVRFSAWIKTEDVRDGYAGL
jgi:hypothetical protein